MPRLCYTKKWKIYLNVSIYNEPDHITKYFELYISSATKQAAQIQSTHAAFLPANDPSASDNWPRSSLLQESVRLSWHKANTPKQQKAQKIWVALGNYIWPKIYDTQWKTPWRLWLIPNPWPEKNSADRRTVLQIQPKYEEACFPKLLNKCNLKHFICSTAICSNSKSSVCSPLFYYLLIKSYSWDL